MNKTLLSALLALALISGPAWGQKKTVVLTQSNLHCPPYSCLDAITGAGNDANAGTEAAPWATLAHADATLATNQRFLIKYPDGVWRTSPPVWHGFLNYWVPIKPVFTGASASLLYDIYSGQNATIGTGAYYSLTLQGINAGIYYNGFGGVSTVSNWANALSPLSAAAFVVPMYTLTAVGTPFAVGSTTTAYISSLATFSDGKAYWDFENVTTGRVSFTPASTVSSFHVWGFLAGGGYQALYEDALRGATQASNQTYTADTHKDLVMGATGATRYEEFQYGFMTKPTTLADTDYLLLNTWIRGTEIPRLFPAAGTYTAALVPSGPLVSVPSNGLALTPPMGWESWRVNGVNGTDAITRAAALAMTTNGMQAAGYNYVATDNWAAGRGTNGHLVPISANWPNGMAAVASYVHSLGLKFGMYLGPTVLGCNAMPGSATFETNDANDLASFGVDRLMYDSCHAWGSSASAVTIGSNTARFAYQRMGQALQATGRSIEYMVSTPCCGTGGTAANNFWGSTGASQWTTLAGGNETYSYNDLGSNNFANEMTILDGQFGFETGVGPGHFNNPDFLTAGTMTDTEFQSVFALWADLASSLLVSMNLSTITANQLAIIVNSEVIAVDQDSQGSGGKRVTRVACGSANCETYAKSLASSKWAVVLFNRASTTQSVTSTWTDFGGTGPYTVRDAINHSNLGSMATSYTVSLPSHGCAMIVLTP